MTVYIGLHPNVLLQSGAARVSDAVKSASSVLSAFTGSSSFSSLAKSVAPATTTTTTTTTTSTASTTSSLWGLAMGAVAAASIAGMAASHPVVQDQIQRGREVVTKHFEFLGPLWKVEEQNERLEAMRVLKNSTAFKCFYLHVCVFIYLFSN